MYGVLFFVLMKGVMMKVDKSVVSQFVKRVVMTFAPDDVDDNKAYYMDDSTIILASDNKLVGITFEVLGQSFNVMSNLELVLTTGDGDDDAYLVDDEDMIKLVNKFLTWRIEVLEKLEI